MENTNEETNIKIYPIYKMLSWDLLFYYSINFIFLTQIKGISAANVLLSEAFYPVFKILLSIPLTALTARIGKRKALIVGNFVNALSILATIVATNFLHILFSQLLSAIGFSLKSIVETNFLYDNLPRSEKRGHAFSKIDGKGASWYYYVDAVTSILAGFLYILNGYLPLILCLLCCVISTIIAYKFKQTEKDKPNKKVTNTKQYIKDLRYSFKYMMQSNRLKYLFMFGATFTALLSVLSSPRSGILQEIGVPEQYFGVIFAVLGFVSGIYAKNQNKIHNKFRNRTLAVLSVPTSISCILIGFFVLADFPFYTTLILILMMYLIQYMVKGVFYTLIKRYLNNFTTSALRDKIISGYNFIESISRALIALIASLLLKITTASNTILVIGCIITIMIVLLLDKMRNKVGLKPEEYDKKDIEFIELH